MSNLPLKVCTKCCLPKSLGDFPVWSGKTHYRCRSCQREDSHNGYLKRREYLRVYHRERYKKSRDRMAAWHREYGRSGRRRITEGKKREKDPLTYYFRRSLQSSKTNGKKYGYAGCTATIDDLRTAWTGKCHLCDLPNEEHLKKNKNWLSMDHCHTSGRFRAFLCVHCNTLMRCVDRDPNLLRKAEELAKITRKSIRSSSK